MIASILAPVCLGFAHAQIGDPIESAKMPALDGGSYPLLGNAKVNVFVFIDPAKEHSKVTMAQIAAVQRKLADEPVHWTTVVSDRCSIEDTLAEAASAELEMPILVDADDALYGKLGVALHPVIGITDQDHILRYYLPFRKVNYSVIIEAAIRQVLGQISIEEFEQAVNPSFDDHRSRTVGKKGARLKLAQRLFDAGRLEDALTQVEYFMKESGDDVGALILLAKIRASGGDMPSARAAVKRAIELDPENTASQELLRSLDAHP